MVQSYQKTEELLSQTAEFKFVYFCSVISDIFIAPEEVVFDAGFTHGSHREMMLAGMQQLHFPADLATSIQG